MSLTKPVLLALACTIVALFATAPPATAQSTPFLPDILLDSGDATSGWKGQNTLSLDTQIKVQGSASMKSVGARKDRFRKVFTTPVDVSRMRYLTFWYYVDNPDLLGAVGGTKGQVEISSSGTFDEQEQNWNVHNLHLQRGWNFVVLDLPGNHRGTAPIDLTRVNHFRIYHDPSASITTRIDEIRFTNRDPASNAFAEYLRKKRVATSSLAAEQQDYDFQFVLSTAVGSGGRARYCRQLRLDLVHRQVNAITLQSMGITAATTDAEVRERTFFKEFICGERAMSRNELIARLQQRAATDVAVTREIAALYDFTFAAAAETKDQLLETDLNRILSTCGATDRQIDAFIQNATLPTPMTGSTVLTRTCAGGPSEISVLLNQRTPTISNRRTAYQQCVNAFTSQAAECDNPYGRTPDETYAERLWQAARTIPERDAAYQRMQNYLQEIQTIEVDDARREVGGTFPNRGHEDNNELHEQYDVHRAQIERLDDEIADLQTNYRDSDLDQTTVPPELQIRSADIQRLQDEKRQLEAEAQDLLNNICFDDSNNSICPQPPPGKPPTEPSPPPETSGQGERCASMQFSDGQTAWFDRPAGAFGIPSQFGSPSQLNEGDRIDHCMCELFDRGYPGILPGATTLTETSCPTPEERAAQKCLENPQDGRDGIRPECRHLMQPISMDRDALGGRMCEKILPNCDHTFLKPDNSCGCATIATNGTLNLPGCRTGVPNCPEGTIPMAVGCGCMSVTSGAGTCTEGGKDFYLTRDPINDLKVRVFPNQPNFATDSILLAKEGDMRFATAGIKRNQVFDASRLWLTAVLPGTSYDGTGKIDVSCTNLTTGASNRLIESIPMSMLSNIMPTMVPINLSTAERAACFGTNPNSRAHFEFFVDSKVGQPVGFFDILGGFGDIKPPCIDFPPRPTPGPRPLNAWPTAWTFSDGATFAPRFNGTGPMPTPSEPPPPPPPPGGPLFPVCQVEGVFVPCP